ncbi:hypothetical protein H9L05_12150 [Hymenobacter qilianensis]|uniref:Secreted protein n=1 Tax=Hymenobacter qilianensis TaxID=1385715 RepID=A0A7H0GRJ7_9BACT|nr:hypothetical protein [Hymenobacter qilianensis]QNP50913.1 hypothetical protein H9L05_12150 [Hymenobacter qilianensis]
MHIVSLIFSWIVLPAALLIQTTSCTQPPTESRFPLETEQRLSASRDTSGYQIKPPSTPMASASTIWAARLPT